MFDSGEEIGEVSRAQHDSALVEVEQRVDQPEKKEGRQEQRVMSGYHHFEKMLFLFVQKQYHNTLFSAPLMHTIPQITTMKWIENRTNGHRIPTLSNIFASLTFTLLTMYSPCFQG